MDALIHHLEQQQELSPREVEVAVSLLLDPAAPDAKKERLLEALANKGAGQTQLSDEILGYPGTMPLDLKGQSSNPRLC